ncbi:hypothetical protein ABZT28_35265 [Streptomyces sp. NPDC005388]|uniref:hypothetical protein n=1 Tax=Streptomyces sp. NPDC005388 TaxID=3156717 RepID=UPI0033A0BEDE
MEIESLEKAASGAIWGNVWHEFDGQYFPHWRWNDMVIPYFTALAQGAGNAIDGHRVQAMFFDGPFSIEIVPESGSLQLVPQGASGVPACAIESATLSSSVVDTGLLLLEACERSGWADDNDVRQLKAALRRLS